MDERTINIIVQVVYKELKADMRAGKAIENIEPILVDETMNIINSTKIVEDKLKANKPTPGNPQGNKPF